MGKYCYVAFARRRARRLGAHGETRWAGAYCVATRTACFFAVSNMIGLFYPHNMWSNIGMVMRSTWVVSSVRKITTYAVKTWKFTLAAQREPGHAVNHIVFGC